MPDAALGPVGGVGPGQGWRIQASAAARWSTSELRVGTCASSVVHSEIFASRSTSVTIARRSSFLMSAADFWSSPIAFRETSVKSILPWAATIRTLPWSRIDLVEHLTRLLPVLGAEAAVDDDGDDIGARLRRNLHHDEFAYSVAVPRREAMPTHTSAHKWRSGQFSDAAVEGGPGHTQIPCHLGGWIPRLDQPHSVADLGSGEGMVPDVEVLASNPALGHGVDDPLPVTLLERGHRFVERRTG